MTSSAPEGLADAAEQLYALPPTELADFGRLRGELVKQARSAGDRELAVEIGKLKKPVQAAALVNALVRTRPSSIDELAELAGRLRQAHRQLRGTELRELSEQRQQLLTRLTAQVGELAPQSLSEAVLGQVRATLEAAIADEAAEHAVRSGRLTAALSYSGFGEVDLSDAVALPRRLVAVPEPKPPAQRKPAAGGDEAARRELARAEAAHREALDRLDGQLEALDSARDEQRARDAEVARLADELAEARTAAAAATEQTARAERAVAKAQRALERAERALRGAQQ